MKKISTFLLLSFLLTVSLFAQTGPCDLPSSLTMHEVPLYWGEKFGSPQNPLKTDREIRIHKTVKLLLPPYFGHLHLNWIKFEEEEIQITSSDTELSHEYATTGEKNIIYNYYYNGLNNTQVLKLTLKENTGEYILPDERWTITSDVAFTPTHDDIYPDDSPYAAANTSAGEALACIKYAEGHTSLVKPIVFVAGFDPVQTTITDPSLPADDNIIRYGGNGWDVFITGADESFVGEMPDREIFSKYPETMDGFLAMGYDIVLLDFANGGDYIQKNSELLIALLERINDEKTPDPNGIIYPNVVLGASMGGLITRYALKTMENRNIPHCTKTMITFDSPLKGANAPLGVQAALWFNYAAAQHSASDKDDACGNLQWSYLNQPAARQQLQLHLVTAYQQGIVTLGLKRFADGYLSNSFTTIPLNPADFPADFSDLREDWVAEFAELGYPDKCTRIAVACGSQTGMGSGVPDGGMLFNAEIEKEVNVLGIEVADFTLFRLDVLAGEGGASTANAFNFCDLYSPNPLDLPLPIFINNAKTPERDISSDVLLSAIIPIDNTLGGTTLPILGAPCDYYYGLCLKQIDTPFFDGAPGGTRSDMLGFQNDFETRATENNLSDDIDIPAGSEFMTFVPTVSALDIQGEWSDELLSMNISTSNVITNNLTAFDDYHAPQGNTNLKHVEIDDGIKNYVLGNIGTWSSVGNLSLTAGQIYNHAARLRLLNNTIINSDAVLAVNANTGSGFGSGITPPNNSTFRASGFFGCIPTDITVRDAGLFKIGSLNSERNGEVILYDGSTVIVENGGRLQMNKESELIMTEGTTMRLQPGSTLEVRDNSTVFIEDGAVLIIDEGANIDLKGLNSRIEIKDGGTLIFGGGSMEVPSFNKLGSGSITLHDGWQGEYLGSALHLDGQNEAGGFIIELLDGAEIDLPAGIDLKIYATSLLYGSTAAIHCEGGEVEVRLSVLVGESGSAQYAVATDNPIEFNLHGSTVRGFVTGVEINHLAAETRCFFTYDNFTGNAYCVRVNGAESKISFTDCNFNENPGAAAFFADTYDIVNFTNCRINGDRSNVMHALTDLSSAGINNGIQLVNSINLTLNSTQVQHCNVAINGILDTSAGEISEIDEFAANENNIVLISGSTLRNNAVGIWTNGDVNVPGPPSAFIDYGSVLMDCAALEYNHIGIKGRDVLLQIDAIENCGSCEPYSEQHRPNTFIKPYGGSLYFDICLENRAGMYGQGKVPMKGNYWGSNVFPNVNASFPSYFIRENCGTSSQDELAADYEFPITDTPPRGCKPFEEPGGPTIPNDDECEMNVATTGGTVQVAVHQEYHQGKGFLYTEDLAAAKEKLSPTAHVADADRAASPDKCRTKIDFARTYVPRSAVFNPYAAPFSDGAATAIDPHGLHISPNPTEGIFTLHGAQGVYTFRIFDTFGKVVAAGDFTAAVSVDLSDVSPGVYFVSVQNRATADSKTLRVVKQ